MDEFHLKHFVDTRNSDSSYTARKFLYKIRRGSNLLLKNLSSERTENCSKKKIPLSLSDLSVVFQALFINCSFFLWYGSVFKR